MQFGHLELGVLDPVASRAWWVDRLGFTLVADQGPEFQWVARGGLEILLRRGTPSPGLSIVYYVDDPVAEGARLRAAGVEADLRGACLHLLDPDGHRIEIVNPEGDHSGG
jgi:catechol 2,3-dioxygenase-like lactoylglutathione lyase family enzyme